MTRTTHASIDRRRREGVSIFTSHRPQQSIDASTRGRRPGAGTYLLPRLRLPALAARERSAARVPSLRRRRSFRRDSIFEPMQEHGGTTAEFAAPRAASSAGLAGRGARDAARARPLPRPTARTTARSQVFPIEQGWTRIGRSAAADIRLDDPSVSRRHALIVSEAPEVAARPRRPQPQRRLPQRREVEWGRLGDGDELAIGRYRLFALEA